MLITKDIVLFAELFDSYDPEHQHKSKSPEDQKLFFFKSFFMDCLRLLKKCNVKLNQSFLGFNKNYYLSLILEKADIENVQTALDADDANMLNFTFDYLKNIPNYHKYFQDHLKPVHQTGQSMVPVPPEVNFQQLVELDPAEKQLVEAFEKNVETHAQEKKTKAVKEDKEKKIEVPKASKDGYEDIGDAEEGGNVNENGNAEKVVDQIEQPVRQKKEYKIIMTDELPEGVNLQSEQPQSTDKPKKKKKKPAEEVKEENADSQA